MPVPNKPRCDPVLDQLGVAYGVVFSSIKQDTGHNGYWMVISRPRLGGVEANDRGVEAGVMTM